MTQSNCMPWLNVYDDWVPHQLDYTTPNTVDELISKAVLLYGDRPAFICGDERITYSQLSKQAENTSEFLQEKLGLKKGMRVAVALPNVIAFPIALLANIMSGFVQVNVNPHYTSKEILHQLNDADCNVVIISSATIKAFSKIVSRTNVVTVIFVSIGDEAEPLPSLGGVDVIPFEEVRSYKAMQNVRRPVLVKDDLLFLQYTGGTTGLSKGAMLTHGNIVANIAQTLSFMPDEYKSNRHNTVITALPLYHIFALTINFLGQFSLGVCNVLVTNPSDMLGFVEILKQHPFTFFTGVNTLYNGLLHTSGIEDVKFSSKAIYIGGGAPVQSVVSEKWQVLTGKHIIEGYGLSETSPTLTLNLFSASEFISSIGLPLPDTDISIRDDYGNIVAIGDEGELCAKGPQVMTGYWRQNDKTSEAMTGDGYFRTGDIAVMNPDGFFRIVDRKKDMILVSGFNVYPNEIEETVANMSGVVECACIGVPSDKTGEAVHVYIVRTSENTLTAKDVQTHCRETLAAYKVPKKIIFIEALPKSTVGKVLRRELRASA